MCVAYEFPVSPARAGTPLQIGHPARRLANVYNWGHFHEPAALSFSMFNTSFLAVLLLLALGFSPTFAWGQTSNSAEVVQAKSANTIWTGLADRIDSERGKIDPSKFPEIQPAIDAFTAATQRFDQFLKNKGTREVREGWQVYLEYDRVLHEIQFGNATQRSNEATDLAFKLARNRVGLERAEIAGLRDAARHVAALAPWSEPDRGRQILENQLTALAELYRQQTTDVPSAEAAAGTATVINSLRQANQLPQLADALSDRFRTSNLLLHLSSDALASLLSRPVNDTRPVNECILGTRILGQAYANGQVTTRLLPSQGSIRLELVMQSHVTSIGIGYNGPVKAHTESNSDVLATKVLTITEQGISASPATAAANLRSRLRGIEHPLPIVRRIAANKAAQQKPQSEAIARQRLEVQTETSFDHQVEAQLQTSGSRLALTTDALVLLNRLGLHEPVRHLSSDQQHVRVDSWIRAEAAGLRPWTFGATRGQIRCRPRRMRPCSCMKLRWRIGVRRCWQVE